VAAVDGVSTRQARSIRGCDNRKVLEGWHPKGGKSSGSRKNYVKMGTETGAFDIGSAPRAAHVLRSEYCAFASFESRWFGGVAKLT
jgi:hypothetical protein